MADQNLRLGDILIRKGWITSQQLNEALEEQRRAHEFLGSILLKKKFITEQQLVETLSEQFKIPWLGLENYYVEWDLTMKFSPSLILEHRCFPLREEREAVVVAMVNPLDAWALSKAESEAQSRKVKFVLVRESDMREMQRRYRQHVLIHIRHSLDEEKE
jgi:type IV pilus assembly protein PilB